MSSATFLLSMLSSYALMAAFALLAIVLLFVVYLRFRKKRLLEHHGIPFEQVPVEFQDFAGWKLRFHMSGRGQPLLLLHGIGANLYCWRWLIPFLNRHFKVIAVDLPGFGSSSKPLDQSYDLDSQVLRLLHFLDSLGVKKSYVIGNSMGGNIALWLALKAPERVLGVAVIAPATSPKLVPLSMDKLAWISGPASYLLPKPALRWAHQRTVSKKNLVDQQRVDETHSTYSRNKEAVRAFFLATAAIRDPRLPHELKNLNSRVLLLWGSRDKLVSKKVIAELESILPHVESHVHMGGGHHLQEDEPEWIFDLVCQFFLPQLSPDKN